MPSSLYPHWTYRTRSASTWRVSSHSLGAKISWSVAINVCPCSFSMPECRKASACWMLPTKPASTLDSTLHAQLSSLGRIGTVLVFDPSLLPRASPRIPKATGARQIRLRWCRPSVVHAPDFFGSFCQLFIFIEKLGFAMWLFFHHLALTTKTSQTWSTAHPTRLLRQPFTS